VGRIGSACLLVLAIASALRAQVPPPPPKLDDLLPKKSDAPPREAIEPPPVVDIPKKLPPLPPRPKTTPRVEPKKLDLPETPLVPPPSIPSQERKPPLDEELQVFPPPPPRKLPSPPPSVVDSPPLIKPPTDTKSSPAPLPPIAAPPQMIVADSPPLQFKAPSVFEDYRIWVGGDFDLWWFKNNPLAVPLVTTTSTPAVPGSSANILGVDPNARVVIGPDQMDQNPSNGARVWLGGWFDDRRMLGLEVVGMWVESPSTVRGVRSNAAGSPIYSRPVTIAGDGPSVYDMSFPVFVAGGFNVESHQFLRGVEANFVGFLVGREDFYFDIIAGARFLNFEDTLDMRYQATTLVPMPAFGTNLLPVGTVVNSTDSYHAVNNFYGGQIGGRLEKTFGRLSLTLVGKLALGVNDMAVNVNGVTSRSDTQAVYSGGMLANASNMGRLTESRFAAIPEANLAIGWWLTPNFRFKVGYNVMYISDVVRAGSQVSNVVNPAAVPVDPMYGFVPVVRSPLPLQRTDFWAEGITFGIDFRY
jgi:hypothetical protein